jgi:hypothetical protein
MVPEETADEITRSLQMLLISIREGASDEVQMLSRMLVDELRRLVTPAGGRRRVETNGGAPFYPADAMGFTTAEVRAIWKLVNQAARLYSSGKRMDAYKALQPAIALCRQKERA